ncbi:MAG: hypothetical protein ACYC8T_02785 [Myxococcaceae bacterium]
MPSSRRPLAPLLAFFALASWGVACLDPLYEVGEEAHGGWKVCCKGGGIDTCLCGAGASCPTQFRACAGGQCAVPGRSCACPVPGATCGGGQYGGAGGGGGGAGGGGGGGGAQDAGTVADAGASDGGVPADGGTAADAGAPYDAGQPAEILYEPCCLGGRVSTCLCAAGGCDRPPFTACPRAACVEAGGSCPSG